METINQSNIKNKKIKLDFKDSKYATGRRKRSIAKVWVKKGSGNIHVNGLKMNDYFKGLPHKRFKNDRDLIVTFHGGLDEHITFADLLVNSNYYFFRKNIVPEFENYKDIYLIANYRSKPISILENSTLLKIPDNFFSDYQNVKKTL